MYDMDATVTAIENAAIGAYIGGLFTTAGGDTSRGLVYMGGDHHLYPVSPPPPRAPSGA